MEKVPFTVLPNMRRDGVDLTLFGQRGSMIAVATFTPEEARELQRLLGVALYQLRKVPRD